MKREVEKGDVIVMMTDGIFEAGKSVENEYKFIEMLKKGRKRQLKIQLKKLWKPPLKWAKVK